MNRQRFALHLALTVFFAAGAGAQSDLFILTSDFATGSTAFLPGGASVASVNLLGIHSDAVGHYQDGRIYIINRLGQDNILVLDPADLTNPVIQFSVDNGSNPQDIEIISEGKAYVSRYASTDLLVLNPHDGTQNARDFEGERTRHSCLAGKDRAVLECSKTFRPARGLRRCNYCFWPSPKYYWRKLTTPITSK